jgi:hypothetical protein
MYHADLRIVSIALETGSGVSKTIEATFLRSTQTIGVGQICIIKLA